MYTECTYVYTPPTRPFVQQRRQAACGRNEGRKEGEGGVWGWGGGGGAGGGGGGGGGGGEGRREGKQAAG